MKIRINPAHKGLLTKEVGKAGLKPAALSKEKTAAKKSGNVKLEKRIVFAQNARSWDHSGPKEK